MHVGSDTLLLERERELAALEGAVAAVGHEAGEVVLVEGPPGVGKTRLVAGARAAARGAGVMVLEARGAELEREFAFGVARQLLETAVLAPGGDELFAGAAGAARRLFAPAHGDAAAVAAGFATLHGLYWLVVNLSDRAPVLVSVDDVHWADDPSMRFLDYLTHRVEGLGVTVVLAGRPPAGGLWSQVAAQAEAQLLRPGPLSEDAVAALVRARLGSEATDELCAACHLATGGNPLFLRELLRALATDAGSPSPAGVTAVGPAAIRRFVRHRLAALGDDATELARAVAVLGDGTDAGLAGTVAGVDDVDAAADALVRADVLAPDERLGFVHPIVRAAVYDELAPGERHRRHAAAARALADAGATPERIAAHLLPGGRTDAAVLSAAAASAAARGAPETAVGYLRRALDDPAAASERAELLTELGRCELAAMDLVAADEHLHAAVALAAPTEVREQAATLLVRAAAVTGALSAESVAATVEALAAELRDTDRERSLGLGSELLMLSESALALRDTLPARLRRFTAQAAGDEHYEAVAAVHAASAELLQGGAAVAVAERVEAALARGLPPRALTSTLFVALHTLIGCERHATAERWLRAGLEIARREGHAARQGLVLGQLALIALARGELDDALVDADTAMALVDARHTVWLRLVSVATTVHLERGDLEAAAATVALAEQVDTTAERLYIDDFLVARGRLRVAQGELARGVADLEDCGRRLDALAIRWHCDWRAQLLPALVALGEDERAERLAREQLGVVRAVGAPRALGRGLRTAGAALGGEEGLALLEEAVTVLERSPARLELAHALHDLGAELGRRRRRREAREVLRAATELATRCGARALAARARSELGAGGGRRARLEVTGASALTPAERRVCELARAGDVTNRAIAQSLFVTEKTVELHLSSAYRKLGIRSRFQLAESLGA